MVEEALDPAPRRSPWPAADRGPRRGRAGRCGCPSADRRRAVKPIVLSRLRPAMDRAHRGAGAQMADHHPARAKARVDLAQPVGDVLVGQAVKAVAAHALLVPAVRRSRSGRRPRDGRDGTRCRSRRPGDLRPARADLADRRQIVRLVQRRQRDEPLEPVQHRVVHQDRRVEVRAAMDDPMADRARRRHPAGRAATPSSRSSAARTSATSPGAVRSSASIAPAGVLGREMRPGADALELTLERQLEPVARGDIEELELDARRAGIDHQQRAARARHGAATAAAASRRAWA